MFEKELVTAKLLKNGKSNPLESKGESGERRCCRGSVEEFQADFLNLYTLWSRLSIQVAIFH